MADVISNQIKEDLIALLTGHTLKLALFTSSYTPAAGTATYSTTNELSTANGYTQGGSTITTSASGTTTRTLTATQVQWTSSGAGFTARYGVVYDSSNSNHIVCVLDFGSDKTASGGGTFTVSWASGLLSIG